MTKLLFIALFIIAIEPCLKAQELFISNYGNNTVTEYNAANGAAGFTISNGLEAPDLMAVSGTDLYVVNESNPPGSLQGTVSEYNVLTGQPGFTISAGGGTEGAFIAVSGSNLFVSDGDPGDVTQYNAFTGASGYSLNGTAGTSASFFAASGTSLFVAYSDGGSTNYVAEYNAATGNPGFTISSGIDIPSGLAVSGTALYIANYGNSSIREFNAVTGSAGFVISPGGGSAVGQIAILGNELFAFENNAIQEYNAATGMAGFTISTGLSSPESMAVQGNQLFVANLGNATVTVYNATTGALSYTINNPDPAAVAVSPVPEPGSIQLITSAFLISITLLRLRAREAQKKSGGISTLKMPGAPIPAASEG